MSVSAKRAAQINAAPFVMWADGVCPLCSEDLLVMKSVVYHCPGCGHLYQKDDGRLRDWSRQGLRLLASFAPSSDAAALLARGDAESFRVSASIAERFAQVIGTEEGTAP